MGSTDRPQTPGEEIANALSHALGAGLAIAALVVLVHAASTRDGALAIVAASLFGATAILLYGVSAVYHALPPGPVKTWFQRLDHAAIYLFIAGSYMPFLLVTLDGAWRWSLFGVVWGAGAIGVVAKLLHRLRHPLWSTGLYLVMGWVALVAVVPLFERMSAAGLAWLFAGGVAYTVGAIVFVFDNRLRYTHFVWHLFVLAGSTCHFIAAMQEVPA